MNKIKILSIVVFVSVMFFSNSSLVLAYRDRSIVSNLKYSVNSGGNSSSVSLGNKYRFTAKLPNQININEVPNFARYTQAINSNAVRYQSVIDDYWTRVGGLMADRDQKLNLAYSLYSVQY